MHNETSQRVRNMTTESLVYDLYIRILFFVEITEALAQ